MSIWLSCLSLSLVFRCDECGIVFTSMMRESKSYFFCNRDSLFSESASFWRPPSLVPKILFYTSRQSWLLIVYGHLFFNVDILGLDVFNFSRVRSLFFFFVCSCVKN